MSTYPRKKTASLSVGRRVKHCDLLDLRRQPLLRNIPRSLLLVIKESETRNNALNIREQVNTAVWLKSGATTPGRALQKIFDTIQH